MKVRGLTNVTNMLKKAGKEAERGTKDAILVATLDIANSAEAKARTIGKGIRINHNISDSGLTGTVQASYGANAKIAAYIEFGTGKYAAQQVLQYSKDIQDLAMQFYVNGQGNLPSKPYLIPAYVRGRKRFLKTMRKLIKGIGKV